MSEDLSKLTVMVVDNGLFQSVAHRLARDFGKVYYYTTWETSFPKVNRGLIGSGFPDIERIGDVFGDHFDEVDLFVFPDLHFGMLQQFLVEDGRAVFGARLGEELEILRPDTKALFQELGLPVGPYAVLVGMKALRAYLQQHPNVWVKLVQWRGHVESFFSKRYAMSQPVLDALQADLGELSESVTFVVEDDLPDKVEAGVDGFITNGQLPNRMTAGLEIKDESYVCACLETARIPEPLTRAVRALGPTLAEFGYCGPYSDETRIGADRVPYTIDLCTRCGSPPTEIYQEMFADFSQNVWDVANGRVPDVRPAARYGAQLIMRSTWSDRHWQPLDFPAEFSRNIKLRNAILVNGRPYIVPQHDDLFEFGSIIGLGDTLQAAIDQVEEIADQVEGQTVKIPKGAFDVAEYKIAQLSAYGVSPFDPETPKESDHAQK